MKRDFEIWLDSFKESIADYKYYVDFDKIYLNTEKIKIELNILNSLIGSKNIENDFRNIAKKYPEILKCIPILLAVRKNEISVTDTKGTFVFNFAKHNFSIDDYIYFMKETGLFDLLQNHIINNLFDYVTGVEIGLDSNGRKNRGGHLMENLVETYIKKYNYTYFKEMYASDIESKYGIDLSSILNNGESEKRFDFVIITDKNVYGIETNFYTSGGSKLNETARSYKTIAIESKEIKGFKFIWITDGLGWKSAKKNLKETFDVLENLYNINDLQNGVLSDL